MPEAIRVANWREKTDRSRMLTLLKRWKIALELERLALLGDVEDDQPALAQLLGDLRLDAGLDLAAGGNAGEVDGAEGEGAHRLSPSAHRRRLRATRGACSARRIVAVARRRAAA